MSKEGQRSALGLSWKASTASDTCTAGSYSTAQAQPSDLSSHLLKLVPTLQIFGPQTLAQLLRACRMQQQHQGEGRGSDQDGSSRPGSQVVSLSSPPPASYRNILRSFSFTLIFTCLLLKPSQIILLDFLLPPNCEASYCEKQVSFSLKQTL